MERKLARRTPQHVGKRYNSRENNGLEAGQNNVESNETKIVAGGTEPSVERVLPPSLLRLLEGNPQKAIPALAKDTNLLREVLAAVAEIQTHHTLLLGV